MSERGQRKPPGMLVEPDLGTSWTPPPTDPRTRIADFERWAETGIITEGYAKAMIARERARDYEAEQAAWERDYGWDQNSKTA